MTIRTQSRVLFSCSLFLAVLLGAGCASPRSELVLSPVGPPPVEHPRAGPTTGTLIVYSAYETGANSMVPDDIQLHTSYEIHSEQGALLQTVPNRSGSYGAEPTSVELPPGRYVVSARANGHGVVKVPVIVAEKQTTTVHLERGLPATDTGKH